MAAPNPATALVVTSALETQAPSWKKTCAKSAKKKHELSTNVEVLGLHFCDFLESF